MRTAMKSSTCEIFALLFGSVFVGLACGAEQDFEFAKGLLDKDSAAFKTDDLVEQLVTRLAGGSDAEKKTEALLIESVLRRRQSEKASPEKREELLKRASELCQKFLADGIKHRLYPIAQQEEASLQVDTVKAKVSAAKELTKQGKTAEAARVRTEAAGTLDKIAETYRVTAEASKPKFDVAHAALKAWNEKYNTDPENPKAAPRDIIASVDKPFSEWLVADRKHLAYRLDQVECYDDADAEKKTLATKYIALAEERAMSETLQGFPLIVAWYKFMQGRLYASIQNEEKAGEAWEDARTTMQDMQNLSADQNKQLLTLQRLILHGLVKLRNRCKKYDAVEAIVKDAMRDHKLAPLFEESAGKELILDFGKAMVLKADATQAHYEDALKVLSKYVDKENKPGGDPRWAYQYMSTMAEILQIGRKNKVRPMLSANAWYEVGRGSFGSGLGEYKKYTEVKADAGDKATAEQQKAVQEQYEKARLQFDLAIDYYRRAIAVARSSKTDLATRLQIEPQAWFDIGSSYARMDDYVSAIIAYQALCDTFGKEDREVWMPDQKKPEGKRAYTKRVLELLEQLDAAPDGLLMKGGKALLISLDTNIKLNKKSLWPTQLKTEILIKSRSIATAQGVKIADVSFLAAGNLMAEGRGFLSAGKANVGGGDLKAAAESYQQAMTKLLASADKYMTVKADSEAYERAMYEAGSAYSMANDLIALGRIKDKPDVLDAQTKALSNKALDSFAKYEAQVAKKLDVPEEERGIRNQFHGAIQLAKSTLYIGLKDWDNAIKSSDLYVAWEKTSTVQKSAADTAFLNKYRALIEMGASKLAPLCEPHLLEAEKVIKDWRVLRPKDNKLYVFMLNALSRRYLVAAAQVERQKDKPENHKELKDRYELKLTEFQSARLEFMEEDAAEELTLEDYTRLLFLFYKTQQERKAADWGVKLLAKFDAQNKGVLIADDEATWKSLFARMEKALVTIRKDGDTNRYENCKNDHRQLLDFMYDTMEGRAYDENSPKRKEFDKYNQNYSKAQSQIETIRKNYAKVPTGLPGSGDNNKTLLQMVEEEIDFRQKIDAARDLVSSLSLSVAAQLEKEPGKEAETNTYREIANQQIKIRMDQVGETPDLLIKSAELSMSSGKYDDAFEMLTKVLVGADRGSLADFDCRRRLSEIYAHRKKWQEAADFPEFLVLQNALGSDMVTQRWPDIKEHLKRCYANGAKQPDKVKEMLEASNKKPEVKKPEDKKPESKTVDAEEQEEAKSDQPTQETQEEPKR